MSFIIKLIDNYKDEISTLKGYIIRINNELTKKNIILDTPNIIKFEGESIDDYDKFINDFFIFPFPFSFFNIKCPSILNFSNKFFCFPLKPYSSEFSYVITTLNDEL